jgi:membrane associated rhomboid family serine protease
LFPIRDTIPSRSLPLVTWTLIAVNVVVFLFELTLPPELLERFFNVYGMVPAAFGGAPPTAAPLPESSSISFFTSMFLHGGLFHLIANMWTLWIFGDNVEDRMGPLRFLVFYLLCGLIAALAHLLTNLGSSVPTVGASGAIAGVLGAYFILFPYSRVVTLIPIFFWPVFVQLPAFFYLGFWFLTQVMSGGMATGSADAGGIAWWAHVGGFVAGVLLYRFFLRRKDPPGPARHVILAHPPARHWG